MVTDAISCSVRYYILNGFALVFRSDVNQAMEHIITFQSSFPPRTCICTTPMKVTVHFQIR
jgi:hypothetical protein